MTWSRPWRRTCALNASSVVVLAARALDGGGKPCARSLSQALSTSMGSSAPATDVTVSLRFEEEPGYEPPQGMVRVEACAPEGIVELGVQPQRWQLSEDPDDRKDSLWIWGLFKEPLYPFLLMQLELAAPLELGDGASIPAGPLFFQVDHRRADGSVQLGEGAVTYKVTEKIKADLVGLSDFSYGEPVPCGTIRFQDTAEQMKKSYV